jgi:hypothetical protein
MKGQQFLWLISAIHLAGGIKLVSLLFSITKFEWKVTIGTTQHITICLIPMKERWVLSLDRSLFPLISLICFGSATTTEGFRISTGGSFGNANHL